jgi:hypothetical protein
MKQMRVAAEILCVPIAFTLFYQLVELIVRYKLNALREYKLTLINNLEALYNKTNKSNSNQKINALLYLTEYQYCNHGDWIFTAPLL